MTALNPDFSRLSDEVISPPNITFGWGDPNKSVADNTLHERIGQDKLATDMPYATTLQDNTPLLPEIARAWADFQKFKGRGEGSNDWTLLDEFVLTKSLAWLPQPIGSCVVSNTLRGWVIRLKYQIALQGQPQEYLGRNEFGPNNYSPYGPWSYGAARKRVNMRGGDGLYCEAMQNSLLKDGVLPCNTPALVELLTKLKRARNQDFPEPQDETLYRQFGNWSYIEELRQYADYVLDDCPTINSIDQLDTAIKDCKPVFMCSSVAIKKIGMHKDGFALHGVNTRDQWMHNMCWHGDFTASDGAKIRLLSNESWPAPNLYAVPDDQVKLIFNRYNPTCAAIGNIRGPRSAPPVF
jgi:hypothetical protein